MSEHVTTKLSFVKFNHTVSLRTLLRERQIKE